MQHTYNSELLIEVCVCEFSFPFFLVRTLEDSSVAGLVGMMIGVGEIVGKFVFACS